MKRIGVLTLKGGISPLMRTVTGPVVDNNGVNCTWVETIRPCLGMIIWSKRMANICSNPESWPSSVFVGYGHEERVSTVTCG